ncbi:MAG: AraC family transcriptional regulator [Candidatus Bipolaricaulaceae bacterium]
METQGQGHQIKMSFGVRDLPELHVAYVRHVGPYNGIGEAFEKLFAWAGPRGLARPEAKTLAVYHDDPQDTDPAKLRSSACLTVPQGTEIGGQVGTMTIPGGTFAVARAELAPDQLGEAWAKLMQWIVRSGYQPNDRLCYEVYLNEEKKHPQRKFVLDICQPVRPA